MAAGRRSSAASYFWIAAAALVAGAALSRLKLWYQCRVPESEACVWGKAYSAVAFPLETVFVGGAIFALVVAAMGLARSRRRADQIRRSGTAAGMIWLMTACANDTASGRIASEEGRILVEDGVRAPMRRAFTASLLLMFVGSGCERSSQDSARRAPTDAVAPSADTTNAAVRRIRLLPADSFPDLPAAIRAELRSSGCLVPQSAFNGEPHNVVSGHFAAPDQQDWAFLCSQDGVSAIHVLWGGPIRCDTPFRSAEDATYLQGLGGDTIGYSRIIDAIDRERMAALTDSFEGGRVAPVNHDGINDAFVEKGSEISLCVDGSWIALQGMD
ncbi:MAG: hypothetical protein WEF86_01215 [Gemmatimonadota bacterium]